MIAIALLVGIVCGYRAGFGVGMQTAKRRIMSMPGGTFSITEKGAALLREDAEVPSDT